MMLTTTLMLSVLENALSISISISNDFYPGSSLSVTLAFRHYKYYRWMRYSRPLLQPENA
jgi:hypothetical protein